jgi:hypothetical protein
MVRMKKRVARRQHEISAGGGVRQRVGDLHNVGAAAVVLIRKRESRRGRTDEVARQPILLSPCARRLAGRPKAAGRVPLAGRPVGIGIVPEDVDEVNRASGAGTPSERRAQGEDGIIEMRRQDHDTPAESDAHASDSQCPMKSTVFTPRGLTVRS